MPDMEDKREVTTETVVYLKKSSMNDGQQVVHRPLQMKQVTYLFPNVQRGQQHVRKIHPAPKRPQTRPKEN
jgi:hypothetical protein